MSAEAPRRRQQGLSLVEVVVSMVVLAVGVVAVLSTFGVSLMGSVEPMRQKQMTAIAEALLGEILHQPFTFCDPDDANAGSALSAADCTGGAAASQEVLGPTAGEVRLGAPPATPAPGTQFDNVGDYAGFSMNPVVDITGAGAAALAGYTATVAVTAVGGTFGVPANDALQVAVTVTRGTESFTLTGLRFRYAPRY